MREVATNLSWTVWFHAASSFQLQTPAAPWGAPSNLLSRKMTNYDKCPWNYASDLCFITFTFHSTSTWNAVFTRCDTEKFSLYSQHVSSSVSNWFFFFLLFPLRVALFSSNGVSLGKKKKKQNLPCSFRRKNVLEKKLHISVRCNERSNSRLQSDQVI